MMTDCDPRAAEVHLAEVHALRKRLREAEVLLRRAALGLQWDGTYRGLLKDIQAFLGMALLLLALCPRIVGAAEFQCPGATVRGVTVAHWYIALVERPTRRQRLVWAWCADGSEWARYPRAVIKEKVRRFVVHVNRPTTPSDWALALERMAGIMLTLKETHAGQ